MSANSPRPDAITIMNDAAQDLSAALEKHTTFRDEIELTLIAGQILVDLSDATSTEQTVEELYRLLQAEHFDVRRDADPFRLRVDILNT